jgi:Mitochondrial carrier protein
MHRLNTVSIRHHQDYHQFLILNVVSERRAAKFNSTKQKNAGLLKLTIQIAQREGIFRFWRGIGPSVIGSFPGQASYYLAYESTQEVLKQLKTTESNFSIFARGFLAGASAELAGGIFYVPADIVAQRLQIQSIRGFTQNKRLYNGPFGIFV